MTETVTVLVVVDFTPHVTRNFCDMLLSRSTYVFASGGDNGVRILCNMTGRCEMINVSALLRQCGVAFKVFGEEAAAWIQMMLLADHPYVYECPYSMRPPSSIESYRAIYSLYAQLYLSMDYTAAAA